MKLGQEGDSSKCCHYNLIMYITDNSYKGYFHNYDWLSLDHLYTSSYTIHLKHPTHTTEPLCCATTQVGQFYDNGPYSLLMRACKFIFSSAHA